MEKIDTWKFVIASQLEKFDRVSDAGQLAGSSQFLHGNHASRNFASFDEEASRFR